VKTRSRRSAVEASEDDHFVRTASQSDHAYERLEELIATLEIAPGAVLTEQMLSRMLRFWYQHYKEALDLLRLHGALAMALGGGDADRAATESDALLDYIQEFRLATLEEGRG
jgi:DNA-binding GntR family transcriptional regulator